MEFHNTTEGLENWMPRRCTSDYGLIYTGYLSKRGNITRQTETDNKKFTLQFQCE